ncbi:hypothetical protein BC941DRAFT_515088 [Chlamydoabsidia padenii]|nr:hypothetical protein BC941DRAFT_515088 [Chlamydoabsidia padenii]
MPETCSYGGRNGENDNLSRIDPITKHSEDMIQNQQSSFLHYLRGMKLLDYTTSIANYDHNNTTQHIIDISLWPNQLLSNLTKTTWSRYQHIPRLDQHTGSVTSQHNGTQSAVNITNNPTGYISHHNRLYSWNSKAFHWDWKSQSSIFAK